MKLKYPVDWASLPWFSGIVLAFDQSLANTGWAIVEFAPDKKPSIESFGTIRTSAGAATGFEDSLLRGETLYKAAHEVVKDALLLDMASGHLMVAHESPAMLSKTSRPTNKAEGGPISSMCVRLAAIENGISPVMIGATHAKKVVAGSGLATKPMVKSAVLFTIENPPPPHKLNEHVCDAVAIAITAMVDVITIGSGEH